VQSEKQAIEFLQTANTAGVLNGYFTAGLINGKPQVICTDYGVIEPPPTDFVYIMNLEPSGDDYDIVGQEWDTYDVEMDDINLK